MATVGPEVMARETARLIASDKVEVKLERGSDISTLEVNIELPGPGKIGGKPAAA